MNIEQATKAAEEARQSGTRDVRAERVIHNAEQRERRERRRKTDFPYDGSLAEMAWRMPDIIVLNYGGISR